MAFETVTLDMATIDFPSLQDIAALHGAPLRAWTESGTEAVATLVGAPVDKVQARLGKTVGVKELTTADEDDQREALRVLRTWLNAPASYRPPARRPRVERPEGTGQLPVPRTIKPAHANTTCGLCADPVKAGDPIGRFRAPKDTQTYTAMGWLCRHCLYDRRHMPRRHDILLRIFHHLFAGSAVDLNANECDVLHSWLTEDADLASCPAWKEDPLETTLTRLTTSATEDKPTTWIAIPTAHTIVTVLQQTSPTPAEKELLDAVAQHLHEWQTNPCGIDARKYGTGTRYRARILSTTPRATMLSARGGPFDLHQAPARTADQSDTADDD